MDFTNVYEDNRRAQAYDGLEFPGTYYLAYRDIPEILIKHVSGNRAIDFGCGTGRSTRFLKNLGFVVTGVDISEEMLSLARKKDPAGDYRISGEEGLAGFPENSIDLVLAMFTFDNIESFSYKTSLFRSMRTVLSRHGRIISLVSSPEIYTHEWASFSTKDFPENRAAKSREKVRIIMTDVEDRRPVIDIVCPDKDYRKIYSDAGLAVEEAYRPRGKEDEPFEWINKTKIAPWTIYVLKSERHHN